MTQDYNEKLRQDFEEIKRKVERGMLPLVARIPAIDRAVSEYVTAQDEVFERKKDPPIQYRDADILEKYADLILYEELTWSHPDKMSIVEYPIMSKGQAEEREGKFIPKAELKYGDLRYTGKRGVSKRMVDVYSSPFHKIDKLIDLERAMNAANLTDRQRQAVELVYFGDMTQEEAGEVMGVKKHTVNGHLTIALRKIKESY